ncbi:GumC family protein [Caldisalinibacter kiritimatiensis]|uniref:Lipopolysaccharide biosynthesis n=1 Tax=Caldisalinibacter kiritimatiensis TaxID=1304284 RepID=R1CTT4_9FIRM|nr:GumC family protein [Caldisalinibacter kiritimatiensis]EOD00099.1 Lipopolysaccharide biosynthesis [Caldisalinibacter kiritimatiensis]
MENMTQQNYPYEEISLRELIETLMKGWKLIAIITAISIFISGVFSFFIIEPTYEATTTLMASFATEKIVNLQKNSDNIEGILDSISTYPVMTIQTYKEQIKNPKILQNVIDELKLDKEKYSMNTLKDMIELETIKDTNLIAVKVKHTDPELATQIANSVAKNFTEFISDMSRQQASKSSQFLKTQLEVEKEKLDAALVELKQFLSQPKGVDELRREISSKLSELNGYKEQLSREEINYKNKMLNLDMQQKTIEATLKQAEESLEDTPEKLVTKKSLVEDNILSGAVEENSDMNTTDLMDIEMSNEQINPTYLTLVKKINDYKIKLAEVRQEKENTEYSYNKKVEILNNKIESVKKEVEILQVELAEKEHNQKLIERKVNLAQSTYDAFMKKYEETRITESSEIGDSSILIVSKAVTPELPVAPKKVLNLAIAGVLGVMLGVFIAFFKEYWEKSGEEVSG